MRFSSLGSSFSTYSRALKDAIEGTSRLLMDYRITKNDRPLRMTAAEFRQQEGARVALDRLMASGDISSGRMTRGVVKWLTRPWGDNPFQQSLFGEYGT